MTIELKIVNGFRRRRCGNRCRGRLFGLEDSTTAEEGRANKDGGNVSGSESGCLSVSH